MPFAMAEDGYLSPVLARIHPSWNAVDCDSAFFRVLLPACHAQFVAADFGLYLAEDCYFGDDRAFGMAVTADAPGAATAFRIPWGKKAWHTR